MCAENETYCAEYFQNWLVKNWEGMGHFKFTYIKCCHIFSRVQSNNTQVSIARTILPQYLNTDWFHYTHHSPPKAFGVHIFLCWIGYMSFPLFGCWLSDWLGPNKLSVSIFICMTVYVIFKKNITKWMIDTSLLEQYKTNLYYLYFCEENSHCM